MVAHNQTAALNSKCGYVGGEMLSDGVWDWEEKVYVGGSVISPL